MTKTESFKINIFVM